MDDRLIHRTRGRRGRRGNALVMSLVAVLVVSSMAAAYFQLSTSVARRQDQAVERRHAFYLAESGLSEAWAGLVMGLSGNVGTAQKPAAWGNGLFYVEATELSDERVELESHGMYGSASATLSVVAEPGKANVASLGIFSSKDWTIPAGTKIDAYDSALGSYASQDPSASSGVGDLAGDLLETVESATSDYGAGFTILDEEAGDQLLGEVGSNGGLTIVGATRRPTEIWADVVAGMTKTATTSGAVEIHGETLERNFDADLPAVFLPRMDEGGGVTHDSAFRLTMPPGDYAIRALSIAEGSDVVITGPTVAAIGGMAIGANASLEFDTTNGAIHLYINGALSVDPTAELFTSSEDSTQVSIQFVGSNEIVLDAQAQFAGFIYAPAASVYVGSDFELYGALVADQLVLDPDGCTLHYDAALGRYAQDQALPELVSWRIMEIRNLPNAGPSADPFDILGVNRDDAMMPDQAHMDVPIEVQYVNRDGAKVLYEGWESDFDWTDVKVTVDVRRDADSVSLTRYRDDNSDAD